MISNFTKVCFFMMFSVLLTAQEKQNILFIAVDDLKPLLSNYGHSEMITPNFERLAKMGVTFTNAHVQQAVCGPSRASIMTGTNPDVTKVWDLHTNFRESNPDLVSMPEYLISQGYESTGIGKIYHKGSSSKGHDGDSWSIPHVLPEDFDPVYGQPAFNTYQNPETKKEMNSLKKSFDKSKNKNLRNFVFDKLKPSFESADVSDEAYQDGVYAQEGIKKMRMLADKDKPFFLAVGFQRPHLPFNAPKKYWDLYKRDDINLAQLQDTGSDIPRIAFHNYGELRSYSDIPDEVTFGEPLDEDKQRELIHGYMACVSYVDALLGKLLDEYFALGLDKNTQIVLWGDHGFHLGDHTLWCKHSNFEEATHIPLMFAGPGIEKNIKVDHPVELLDVFPTLFDLAGVAPSNQAEGISLVPLMDGKKITSVEKDYAISQYTRRKKTIGYSIRDNRYRYTEWHDNYSSLHPYDKNNIDAYELYDLEKNPINSINFVDDPAYKKVREDLHKKLKAHLQNKQKFDYPFDPLHKRKNSKKKSKKTVKQASNKKSVQSKKSTSKIVIPPASASVNKAPKSTRTDKPNVLVIIADDLGYHDLSSTGSQIYQTPELDELANQSISFSNAYSSYPRCTPSRYGMITATYPVNENKGNLSKVNKDNMFINYFEDEGYHSMYIGKWHLGGDENIPSKIGFDESFAAGSAGGTGTHFYPFNTKKHSKNPDKVLLDVVEAGKEGDYLADLLTDKAIETIEKNADEPFFVVLSHYAVHTPIEAKDEDIDRNRTEINNFDFGDGPEYIEEGEGKRKMRQDDPVYAAMVENLDMNVGRLLDKLEELGIDDNTIVVFTSDHGGLSNSGYKWDRHLATTNLPLRAGKGHLYEGGIRVPLFIRWNKGLSSKKDDENVILGMDVMPTLLDLAIDKEMPKVDGKSYENVINGKEDWSERAVYWHEDKARPHSTGDSKCNAMRQGKWKLLHFYEKGYYELYNLEEDISETENLADKETMQLEKMKSQLLAWKTQYKAKERKPKKKK